MVNPEFPDADYGIESDQEDEYGESVWYIEYPPHYYPPATPPSR